MFAARRHPRLRLRHAPVGQVEIRVVAARNPRLPALAEAVLDVAPRIAVAFAALGDGVELPDLLPRLRVVGADVAAFRTEAFAPGQSLHHLAVDDDRAAGVREALFPIGDGDVPHQLAVSRIQRHQPRIRRRDKQLVLVKRHAAHRALADDRLRTHAVLPDQFAGATVERLDDVTGVDQIDDAVVHDRRRFAGARLRSSPTPRRCAAARRWRA